MPFASCTDIFFTASTSSCFASGTAASAARFMVSTSSSACLRMPNARSPLSTRCSEGGSGILTLGIGEEAVFHAEPGDGGGRAVVQCLLESA